MLAVALAPGVDQPQQGHDAQGHEYRRDIDAGDAEAGDPGPVLASLEVPDHHLHAHPQQNAEPAQSNDDDELTQAHAHVVQRHQGERQEAAQPQQKVQHGADVEADDGLVQGSGHALMIPNSVPLCSPFRPLIRCHENTFDTTMQATAIPLLSCQEVVDEMSVYVYRNCSARSAADLWLQRRRGADDLRTRGRAEVPLQGGC